MERISDLDRRKPELCHLFDIPEDADVVVLSTVHGRAGGVVTRTMCHIEKSFKTKRKQNVEKYVGQFCHFGKVDVTIDKPGRFFLFLKAESALHWAFKISDKTEIVGVATIGTNRQILTGLPKKTLFQQSVGNDLQEGCRHSLLEATPIAGGPAITLFETMFELISGRKIDILQNKGLPLKKNESLDDINDYTSFVVR